MGSFSYCDCSFNVFGWSTASFAARFFSRCFTFYYFKFLLTFNLVRISLFIFCSCFIVSSQVWTKTCFVSFRKNEFCLNCFKFDQESFDYATTVFHSRRSLVIFLLNIVLNIKEMWKDFCCCKKPYERCLVCQAKIYYLNYEYDIYENSFNLDFLVKLQANVKKKLVKIINGRQPFCLQIN